MDVNRTDRALEFYENETNQARLWDVLAVYSWMDDEISYVQGECMLLNNLLPKWNIWTLNTYYGPLSQAGMNDICSPMIILLENEADAFWCFERTMRRLVCYKCHDILVYAIDMLEGCQNS